MIEDDDDDMEPDEEPDTSQFWLKMTVVLMRRLGIKEFTVTAEDLEALMSTGGLAVRITANGDPTITWVDRDIVQLLCSDFGGKPS